MARGKTKSRGIGDDIAKITKATGIDKVVKAIVKDCGCQERKEFLNRTFPYINTKKSCMNEEQLKHFESFKEKYTEGKNSSRVPAEEVKQLIDLYNSVFHVNVKECPSCNVNVYYERLEKVYKNMTDEKV